MYLFHTVLSAYVSNLLPHDECSTRACGGEQPGLLTSALGSALTISTSLAVDGKPGKTVIKMHPTFEETRVVIEIDEVDFSQQIRWRLVECTLSPWFLHKVEATPENYLWTHLPKDDQNRMTKLLRLISSFLRTINP